MRLRAAIMLVAFLCAAGAMLAHMIVDGQGAFLYIIATPFIYLLAIAGRRDLER